jgi:endonuclease YncB( thermonuclease family)
MKHRAAFLTLIVIVLSTIQAQSHRSGCHRWHSCPPDTGSYVCGDLGYCSQCPDNQYCQGGKPRTTAQAPSQTIPSRVPAATKPQRIEEGPVTRVADGDTFTVITSNQTKLRIRMFGIDAPETPKGSKFPGQPYGKEAEAYLKQLVEGKRVKVEIYQVDRYKRLLSTVFLDGKDINLAMIEAGLAEVYRGPEFGNPYKQQYQAAEAAANAAKKGMWVLGDQYESPRDYRRRVGISKSGLQK